MANRGRKARPVRTTIGVPQDRLAFLIDRRLRGELTRLNVPIRPPWDGYTPDINPLISKHTGCRNVNGLIPLGGSLITADGWEQVDSTNLPLGDGGLPASAANAQPIVLTDSFKRISATTVVDDLMAVGAKTAATTHSNIYRLPSGGAWAEVGYTALTGAPAQMTSSALVFVDSTSFPPGAPGSSVLTEAAWVYCNREQNVMFYPDVGAGTAYGDLIEIYRVGDGAAGAPVYPNNPNGFKAGACANYDERMMWLNTVENAVDFHQRVRWSIRGDCVNLEGVGSGFLDLNEFHGEGLRLLNIGNFCAAYFEDGVAFLRRTGTLAETIQRQYVSQLRGIVGPQAVTEIGKSRHFGVFTDGMFIVDDRGTFTEAGNVKVGDHTFNLWKETFYGLLDQENQDRVVCQYNPFRSGVQISFPDRGADTDGTPNQQWFYHIPSDRMWPDNWNNISGEDMSAISMTLSRQSIAAAANWNDAQFAVSWPAVTRSWVSFAAAFGDNALIHATTTGYVFLHDKDTTSRVGATATSTFQFPWIYSSNRAPVDGDPRKINTIDRIYAHIVTMGLGQTMGIEVGTNGIPGFEGSLSQSGSAPVDEGIQGNVQSIFEDFRLPGTYHNVTFSGESPAIFHGFDIQHITEESPSMKDIPS